MCMSAHSNQGGDPSAFPDPFFLSDDHPNFEAMCHIKKIKQLADQAGDALADAQPYQHIIGAVDDALARIQNGTSDPLVILSAADAINLISFVNRVGDFLEPLIDDLDSAQAAGLYLQAGDFSGQLTEALLNQSGVSHADE